MLTRIHVRNLAIVSELHLELGPGMSALTGETGAGKSILIDALGLALGDRGDTAMIRAGEERAEITAVFEISRVPGITAWLEAQAVDCDGELVVRRIISREGRSRAFINGTPVPVQTLQQAGEVLVDIHGQHAHQSLLRRAQQRQLLDDHGALGADTRRVAETFEAWSAAREELEQLSARAVDRADRLDLLRFQENELEALGLAEGELERLNEEHARLANAERLLETCGRLTALLYEDESSVQSQLDRAGQELEALSALDAGLSEPRQLLETALIQVQEASNALRGYLDTVDLDPDRLAAVEQRLDSIHSLARKYRTAPDALPRLLEQLRTELQRLDNAEVHLEALGREARQRKEAFVEAAGRLSDLRREAAQTLSATVSETMQRLGMPGGCFKVEVEAMPAEQAGASGLDRVELLVSANPGQPLQPLARVASGGELSRISLAIQVAAVGSGEIPTLVFDEVDVGIGGAVAEIVGQLLRRLGEHRQVLCVTHLPQVASQGHHHLRVRKHTDGQTTVTDIQALEGDSRVWEIARMLGGVEITESTLAHAREMIRLATR
jgi:DNA repair protein RecN (Recombination protein N)